LKSPSSVDWHFLLIKDDLDLSTTSEIKSLLLFGVLSLNFSQQVVVWIEFLVSILIVVDTSLVVMGVILLPLWDWLDIEELHEVIKLYLIVFTTHRIGVHEEPVLWVNCLDDFVRNGILIFFFFLFIFLFFFITAFAFFAFLTVFVLVFVFIIILIFIFFFLRFSVTGLLERLMGSTS